MRPVPHSILIALLTAMCGLCAAQWWRESALRESAGRLAGELARAGAERDDLNERLKAADAEILRLTAAQADLRSNSVSRQEHDEAVEANARLAETGEKQQAAIAEQNDAIARQNAAIAEANQTIRKVAAERDEIARRINEVTALYNKLVEEGKK